MLLNLSQELVHLDDEAFVGAVRYLALGVPGGHVEDQTAAVNLLECGCCGNGLSDRGCLDVGDVYPSAYSRESLFEQPVDMREAQFSLQTLVVDVAEIPTLISSVAIYVLF